MPKVGVGIVGVGMIAHFHAKVLSEIVDAQLVGVFGRTNSKSLKFAEQYSCAAFDTLEALLSSTEVQMVLIATPTGRHLDIAIKAAMHGVHVLCEKPLEVSTERIEQMIDICHSNEVLLGGIFNRRFNRAVELLKEAIELGRFGQLTVCDAQIKWYRTQDYYDSGGWRGTWDLDGGGALMNQSIHTIDLLQYFVGPIKRLCATMKTLTHQNIEVEDTAAVLLEFENGAIGSIQASTSCWSEQGLPAQVNICGEKGSVFLEDDKFSHWEFEEPHKVDTYIRDYLMTDGDGGLGANDPRAINYDGHVRNISNFIEAIKGKQSLSIDGSEAMKAVKIIESIYLSTKYQGKWITL